MKKRILSLVLSLAMVLSLFAGLAITASAAEEVYYTLTPATGSNNSYAGNCDIEISGITWNLTGNSQTLPWRIGGKSITAVDRTVYSKTAMGDAITKVALEVGAASSITVNSLQLIVASDSEFTTVLDTVSGTFAANSTINFTPTSGTSWASGAYYKFVFNVTVSSTSNKFVVFTGADFYHEAASGGCAHANAAEVAAVAATCTTAGNIAYYYCADCGTYFTDSTLGTITSLAAVTVAATGHTWGSWNVTTAATCTAAGSQTRTCSACNATETEAIPMIAHNYVNGVCSVCGAIEPAKQAGWYLVDDYTSLEDGIYAIVSPNYYAFNGTISSGHGQKTDAAFSFDANGYAASAPSGTLELTLTNVTGGFTLYDSTLGYLYASKASSGGLAFHADESSYWTWSADGGLYAANNAHLRSYNDTFRTYASNSNNASFLAYKYVNASCDHSNATAVAAVAAGCTTAGNSAYYYCADCGKYFTDSTFETETTLEAVTIAATGHTLGAATNNNNGTHTQTCSVCNQAVTSDCTFEVTEAGGNEFECTACGYTKEVTQFYKNTTVADDDQVVIYHPTSGMAMTATASSSKLAGVAVPSDYYSTTKLCIPDGAVVMTVADYDSTTGQFHLTIDDNGSTLYLTSGSTGNSLSFAAAPASGETDYGLWTIDTTTGLILTNVNAAYNSKTQSIEYYNNLFTTYSTNTGSAYQIELFTDAVPACLHPNTTLTGAVAATCLLPGYTGDYVCDDCGTTVTVGSAIAATGHDFQNGTCANCGATQLTAVNVTSLTDGETVYIYNAGTALALTSVTDVSGKFKGVPGSVSGNVLTTSSDATLFTVHVVTGGYKFEDPNGLYLTYGDARDTLTLAADSTKAIWNLDASYHLIDVNSGYTYNGDPADLYLEAYNGYFTTYATSSLSAAFVLAFYDPNATDCTHVWDAGVENPVANCINTGVMTYTCTLCGATRTEVTPATGVHNYVNGECTVCGAIDPSSVDYSGNYYIAAIRSSGNYFWATNTVASNRYTAEDSGLTTLPAEIDSNVDLAKVWTLTKQQDGTYILSTDGGYSNYTSGNVAVLDANSGKALTVTEASAGIFHITFENEESGSTVTRYLSLNGTTGNNYFAYYKNTQRYDLSLIPVTGTIPTPATHTATAVAAVAATCTTAGNSAYYYCAECTANGSGDHYGKYYSDAAMETEIADPTIAALGHDWVSGAVVLPTCTTAGYTPQTCSRCDATQQINPTAALGHTLVYTSNGDGTHDATCSTCNTLIVDDEACTYENGVCTLCGAEEPAAEPILDSNMTIGTQLALNSDLSILFRVKNVDSNTYNVETSYLVVEKDQYPAGGSMYVKTTTFEDYTISGGRVVFTYKGITAAEMNDEVRATFYVEGKDGKLYCSPVKVTSICGYVQTALTSGTVSASLRTCLIDMVNYGAAAQTYFGRHTDALANAAFEDYQQYASDGLTSPVVSVKDTISSGCSTNLVSKFSGKLDVNSSIGVCYTITGVSNFTAENINGLKLVIKDGNDNVLDTLEGDALTIDSKNRIVCTTYVLTARQMRTPVYATLYSGDTAVSDTFVYSIASYLVDVNTNMPGTTLESMIEAMIIYGDSADNSL